MGVPGYATREDMFVSAYSGPGAQTTAYVPVEYEGVKVTGTLHPACFYGYSLPTLEEDLEWSGVVQRVGDSLDGHMQARTNILVNLAELGQTVSMLKNPMKLRGLTKFLQNGSTIKQLIKSGANLWLEKKYGWDNLYRDVVALAKTAKAVEEHYAYLYSTLGRYSPIHSSTTVSGELPPPPSSTLAIGGSLRLTLTHRRTTVKRTGTFGCEIFRDIDMPLHKVWQYASQYAGADKLAEALWDVVPFSFCVDWFFNIAKLIQRGPIMWNSHRLRRLGYSTKQEYSTDIDYRLEWLAYYDCPTVHVGHGSTTFVALKSYNRAAAIPPCDISDFFGGLTLSNVADGAALIAQRIL
jgi:hypothetical protein